MTDIEMIPPTTEMAIDEPLVLEEDDVPTLLIKLIRNAEENALREKRNAKFIKSIVQLYQKEMRQFKKKSKRSLVVTDAPRENKRTLKEKLEVKADPRLLNFLGLPANSKVSLLNARTVVMQYIRENKLQDPDNKRTFKLDDRLEVIFGAPRYIVAKGELGYSYLNVPRYLGDLLEYPVDA